MQFLTAAQTEIRYAAIPVEEIVARHGTQLDFLDAYRQALARGEPFVQAWAKAAQSPLLTPEDARLVGDFGQDFGATDALGQQAHCSLYAELTRKLLSAAEEDYTRKGRLYRLLGLCGGAVLALLVL